MKILKFEHHAEKRFYEWAARYLRSTAGKELSQYPIEHLLAKLVTSKIFTLDKLRAELRMRRIRLNESYFEKAEWLIKHLSDEN